MEKKIILVLFAIFLVPLLSYAVNAACDLDATMVNQDPYPALPGDYVEVLFQISGIGSDCEQGVTSDIILDYPFSLDTGDRVRTIDSTTYAGYGYNSNWNILYKLRIDPDAIEGDYEVELRFKEGRGINEGYTFRRFNITLDDGRTDFEIHVQDYTISSKSLVFEILNVGNQDIEALTVEIPKQDNIIVKGSNRNIVGDLDSNEYTTADFEATPSDGKIMLNIYYTDSTNERRVIEKEVYYDSSYFVDSLENTAPSKTSTYIVIAIIVLLVALFFWRRHRKKRNKKKDKFEI